MHAVYTLLLSLSKDGEDAPCAIYTHPGVKSASVGLDTEGSDLLRDHSGPLLAPTYH